MDQSAQSPNPQQQNKLHALAFWKVGLFEIGFVAVVLLLLFGTLNYFNILSVSDVFPNQLGWLPHKEVSTGTSQQKPTAPSLTAFTYDTRKAETLLVQYLKDNLRPEFLPQKIEVVQGLSDNRQQNIQYQFESYFAVKDSTITTDFFYQEKTNTPNAYQITIRSEKTFQATPTASLANSLLPTYFMNPPSISNCQTKGAILYCENFQITDGGKIGYGIYMGSYAPNFLLFNCFIPKENAGYAEAKSCIKL